MLPALPSTSAFNGLQHLNISRCGLSRLSDAVCELTSLEILDASANALDALPDALERLRALQRLDVRHNRLREFPRVVFRLRALQSLLLVPSDVAMRETIQWYRNNGSWLDHVRSGEYRSYYAEQYGS